MAQGSTMSADAIRSYFRTLRKAQGISQQAVADALDIQRVSWSRYELGKNETMSSEALLTVMRFLQGSFRDLQDLAAAGADARLGASLAQERAAEIARGELSAYRETASTEEFEALLADLDQHFKAEAQTLPRLRDLLRRLRAGGGEPRS